MNLSDFGFVPHPCKSAAAGDVFGRLTVLAIGKERGDYRYFAICQCACGSAPTAIRLDGLKAGKVVGCGCVQRERTTSHRLSRHPLYNVWKNMIARCTDPADRAFASYGGRGIEVCERWRSVESFVADMQDGYRSGLEIDRIDNQHGYSPENCRWATHQENSDNRRSSVMLTFRGKTQSLKRWAEETGLSYGTLHTRVIKHGWSAERALATPPLGAAERMAIARNVRNS